MSEQQINPSVKKPTLWVVTELYYPEETSTGYYLTKIAEGLTNDFTVKVICGQPNYSARGVRAPKAEKHKNVEIRRVVGTTLDKNFIPFRLINMLTQGTAVFLKGLANFRAGEKILVVTTPPSLPFITALAALIKGANYVLLIHDNYPEMLVAVGKLKADSVFVQLLDFFNRWLYKYASRIIVCGRDMQQLVKKKTTGLDVPIDVIQNWAELENVEPLPRSDNKLLKELNLQDKLVFLYAGNLGYPNDIETIIDVAEKLNEAMDERFFFLFLGSGIKKKWLEKTINVKKLRNVRLLSPRPRSEQNEFLNACDIGLITLVEKMRGVSVPSRTYNILAAGKPVLAIIEDNSEVADIVREEQIGWVTPPSNSQKLLSKIFEIYEQSRILPDLAKNSRNAALDKYSFEEALTKYKKSLIPTSDNE